MFDSALPFLAGERLPADCDRLADCYAPQLRFVDVDADANTVEPADVDDRGADRYVRARFHGESVSYAGNRRPDDPSRGALARGRERGFGILQARAGRGNVGLGDQRTAALL